MAKPYIAKRPIFINGARAYNPGDVVSDAAVKAHSLEELVAREGTQAAEKATEKAATPST